MAKCSPSKFKSLNSNSSTTKLKKRRKTNRRNGSGILFSIMEFYNLNMDTLLLSEIPILFRFYYFFNLIFFSILGSHSELHTTFNISLSSDSFLYLPYSGWSWEFLGLLGFSGYLLLISILISLWFENIPCNIIVVLVLGIFIYVQTHQIMHAKHLQLLYINTALVKLFTERNLWLFSDKQYSYLEVKLFLINWISFLWKSTKMCLQTFEILIHIHWKYQIFLKILFLFKKFAKT